MEDIIIGSGKLKEIEEEIEKIGRARNETFMLILNHNWVHAAMSEHILTNRTQSGYQVKTRNSILYETRKRRQYHIAGVISHENMGKARRRVKA